MVDYNKSTGSSGTMRIRDNGSTIEFWISSGNSTTYAYDMPWAYIINGVSSSWREFRYEAGDGFQRLGTWTVTTSQTVTFKLGDTDTSGLGGPTNFSVSINRATRPNAPGAVTFSGITSTSVNAAFTDGSNNGAAIDSRQIGRNTVNTITTATIISSDGSTAISGLSPGTLYYFWARTHNSQGYSNWSPVRSITTLRTPFAPVNLILTNVTQTSVDVIFTDGLNGGAAITGRQIGYSLTNDVSGATIISSDGSTTVTNLSPGITYYFWARAVNSVGNGDWSIGDYMTLVAGAHIKVGAVWKRAVPYVRVGGVWKVARSWGRTAGVWKETI